MAAPVLKFKRGNLNDLPALAVGEPGFTIDKFDLYLGSSSGNQFVGSGRYWSTETASVGSAVNLFEATANGTNKISLKAPLSVGSDVEFIFPASQGAVSSVLTNDGSGNLSWSSGSLNAVFTGIATFNTTQVDINSTLTVSGISTFEDTTDNTLGNVDSGAVQIDGGVGIAKNLTVGAAASITSDFYVVGLSTFEGAVEFRGGTINLGDSDTDNIVLGGEINSNVIPNTDDTFDLGSSSKQWRDLFIDGTADIDALNVGIGTFVDINVSGATTVTGALDVNGGADISGGETTLSSATVSDLTAGRVVLAGTSGALEDDASLTYSDTTGLVVGNSGVNVTGVSTFSTDVVVGGDIRVNGNDVRDSGGNAALTFDGSQGVTANAGLTVTGTLTANGAVDLGDAVTDSITVTGRFDSSLIPLSDDAVDLGTSGNQWRDLFIDGTAEIDALNVGIGTFTDINVGGALTVTGAVDFNGGLDVSGAETVLSSATVSDLTSGRVVLAGASGALTDSGDLTFSSNTLTVVNTIDVTTLEASNIKAKDGTAAITIADSTGNVTLNGNLTVLGSQTIVNTETLKVEDSLIEIGLVNSGGDLIAPTTDADIDVGTIFHYFVNSTAKKAAVFWDDSEQRIGIGSDVSESTSVLTIAHYADLQIKGLWISDCAGTQQVISCTGSTRFLNDITVDGGTFV